MSAIRNPGVLVIGSGLHRELLQDQAAHSPLANWRVLLEQVWQDVKCGASFPSCSDNTLTRERMVTALATESKQPAWSAEISLRRAVGNCLKRAVRDAHLLRFLDHWLIDRLRNFHGDIVCLNFDNLLEKCMELSVVKCTPALNKKSAIPTRNLVLLFNRWVSQADPSRLRLWHPHGYANSAESIRLGLRDYGAAPTDYREAFASFKQWERKVTGGGKSTEPLSTDRYKEVTKALDHAEKDLGIVGAKVRSPQQFAAWNHWITRFMLRPVTFIGVGLSRVEFGLRWLLVQRERNLARVDVAQRPPLRILRVGSKEAKADYATDFPFEYFTEPKAAWEAALQSQISRV